jgi:hypothetical protein
VLALALAVPALLFYGWWSRMDAAKKKELNRKIRDRGVGAFSTSGRNKDRLANPISGAPEGPSSTEPAAAPVSTEPSVAPTEPLQAVVEPQPSPEPAPVAESAVEVSTQTARYYLQASGMSLRDPMLSPYDLIKIQREELERRLNDRAIQEEIAPKKRPKPREVMPSLDLQGIISTADGEYQAIVNDNLVRQGDSVAGGKIKVLKISASAVVFGWKTKKFTRSVNQ